MVQLLDEFQRLQFAPGFLLVDGFDDFLDGHRDAAGSNTAVDLSKGALSDAFKDPVSFTG